MNDEKLTATERLRQLLDERGEYYKTSGDRTWWGRPIDAQTGKPINVFHNQAQPMGDDRLFVELQLATPAQAIEATLGRGTCEWCANGKFDGQTVMMSNHGWQTINYCPNCGRRVVGA